MEINVKPAFLFDLDGTLVDSVYHHVLASRDALEEAGIELAVWRIHRRIGMSGGLFLNALQRETGITLKGWAYSGWSPNGCLRQADLPQRPRAAMRPTCCVVRCP